jgi:RHS repeat-associated protein
VLDAAGRVASVTRVGLGTYAYSYDLAGNVTSRTYPDASRIDYGYDDSGRLASATATVSDSSTGGTRQLTSTYSYDVAGNLISQTLPDGSVEIHRYDAAGRVFEVENRSAADTLISRFTYMRDGNGNPIQIDTTDADGLTTTRSYAYDDASRLIRVCESNLCGPSAPVIEAYSYDDVGNRLGSTDAHGERVYRYDIDDRLLKICPAAPCLLPGEQGEGEPDPGIDFDYDHNGNMVLSPAGHIAYDQVGNRITEVRRGLVRNTFKAEYSYDGHSNRTGAVYTTRQGGPGGATTVSSIGYSWDTNNALAELAIEVDGSGTPVLRHLQALSASDDTAGGEINMHHDALGSVTDTTDETGALTYSFAYSAYGETTATTLGDGSQPWSSFGFTGAYEDREAGLTHMRARDYDPTIGRFLTVDPQPSLPGEVHEAAYGYVGGRPCTATDPSGRSIREGLPPRRLTPNL